jgi:hypothetical protein
MLTATIIFEPHEIDTTFRGGLLTFQARSAKSADVDGDGDMDVISASQKENRIVWHENVDGAGTFRPQPWIISNEADRANYVVAADLNRDGNTDALYASAFNNTIAWFGNNGAGGFGETNVISSQASLASSITAADLDGDGDLDVLATSVGNDTVAWYENIDGAGAFSPQRVITDQADGARSVDAADLDLDGDLDVLFASPLNDTIAWHENLDGNGTFGDRKMISLPNPNSSHANFISTADLDGDGDLDVLSASYIDEEVSWYENTDGRGTFGLERVIMHGITRPFPRVDTVSAGDLDGDGDLDIVSADELGHMTYWSENIDGLGAFGSQQLIGPSSELTGGSFQLTDLDNDGDLDILAASDHEGIVAWHENRLIGDSNDDGVFNTSDLIRVFQAGEYRDDILRNSTFDEGDWNLDGDFDSSDLVLAFQAGTYTIPNSTSMSRFAAAVDWLFDDDDLACGRHVGHRATRR